MIKAPVPAWRHALAAAIAGLAAAAQAAPPAASPPSVLPPIALANAEDMAAPDKSPWVLASVMASDDVRPGLKAIARSSGRIVPIYPARPAPAGAGSLHGRPTSVPAPCTGAPAPGEFSGHGIAYWPMTADSGTLYVINHGRGETIEILNVAGLRSPRAAPRVTWRACIALPERTVGNAVVAMPDGRLYATLTPLRDGLPQPGRIGSWTAQAGWQLLEGAVNIPTGLVASPDGKVLYASSFADRKVFEISLANPAGPRREVALPFGPDNLSLARDGAVLAGGLEGAPRDIMVSCKATHDPRCAFPGHVARIEPRAFTPSCMILLGPTVTTTATQVGRELWFGSSRSPMVWRAPASVLTSCPQRINVGAEAVRRAIVPPPSR